MHKSSLPVKAKQRETGTFSSSHRASLVSSCGSLPHSDIGVDGRVHLQTSLISQIHNICDAVDAESFHHFKCAETLEVIVHLVWLSLNVAQPVTDGSEGCSLLNTTKRRRSMKKCVLPHYSFCSASDSCCFTIYCIRSAGFYPESAYNNFSPYQGLSL